MASLFEQYERSTMTTVGGGGRGGGGGIGGGVGDGNKNMAKNEGGIVNMRSTLDEPIFVKNKIDFTPPQAITHMVVSNNQLLMAMINKILLKIDLMKPNEQVEIDLNTHLSDKTRNSAISDLFIDPTGRHCIISMYAKSPSPPSSSSSSKSNTQQKQQNQHQNFDQFIEPISTRVPVENFYYNKIVHRLTKLRGMVITAVGWNMSVSSTDGGGGGDRNSNNSTGNILIGTNDGRVFETQLKPDERFLTSKELFLRHVCNLPSSNETTTTTTTTVTTTATGGGGGGGVSGLFSSSGSSPVPSSSSSTSMVAGTGTGTSTTTDSTTTGGIGGEPICAINCFKLSPPSGLKYCILVATANFLYYFIGDLNNTNTTTATTTSTTQSALPPPPSSSSLASSAVSAAFNTATGYLPGGFSDIGSTSGAYLHRIFELPSSRLHKEMPGYLPYSRLDLYYPPAVQGSTVVSGYPKAFGWLTKPGIFYNEIPHNLGSNLPPNRLFDDAKMIMYNDLTSPSTSAVAASQSSSSSDTPISLVLTKFHLLLLYPTQLRVVCTLNQQVIMEDRFSGTYGRVLGMCRDTIRGTLWLYAEHAIYRYKINQEDRNIWEIYLKKKDFAQARLYAGDDLYKQDRTICEEALHHFSLGNFKLSAHLFATARSKSFEEIALKFLELKDKDQEALKEFLLCKLRTLSLSKDRTQIIILLVWLLEIGLNQLCSVQNRLDDTDVEETERARLKKDSLRLESSLKELIGNATYRPFFSTNRTIIYNLIYNHFNPSILIYFAEHIDDFERLLDYHLQQCDYDRALNILQLEESLPLYYRYAPVLIQERPQQLITQLLPLARLIDFARLIPALVHFDTTSPPVMTMNNDDDGDGDGDEKELEMTTKTTQKRETQCREILRLLEYAVFELQTDSSLVHNYLIALYAQYQPDKLLTYLQLKGFDSVGVVPSMNTNETNVSSSVPYDVRYAARLCTQLGLGQATVFLLATMGAIEEAVEQALASDNLELAKQTADKVSTVQQPELAKRLWLKLAKYVIKKSTTNNGVGDGGGFNVKMATDILQECPLLKIEDILPYFPEFSTIDHFKDAICASLEEYNRNIETLRDEMSMATESAQVIREEITKLRNRFTVISATDRCSICEYFILTKAFYSFQCGHLFHADCLLDEVRPQLSTDERKRLEELEKMLSKMVTTTTTATATTSNTGVESVSPSHQSTTTIDEANKREKLYDAIDNIVAGECLYCGHLMIASIDKPFIGAEEKMVEKSWY